MYITKDSCSYEVWPIMEISTGAYEVRWIFPLRKNNMIFNKPIQFLFILRISNDKLNE